MTIFTYRNLQAPNQGLLIKSGLETPAFQIDFTDGLTSSAVAVSSGTTGAVNTSNVDVTTQCVSSMSVGTAVATIAMATCSTGGTAIATDGDRFRLRTSVTLTNSRVLNFDTFVWIVNPTYDPS